MGEIVLLTLAPLRFRLNVAVSATIDDVGNSGPEPAPNPLPNWLSSLVFDGVVQQGGNGLVPPCSRSMLATAIRCET
jgi:hypothetical protein